VAKRQGERPLALKSVGQIDKNPAENIRLLRVLRLAFRAKFRRRVGCEPYGGNLYSAARAFPVRAFDKSVYRLMNHCGRYGFPVERDSHFSDSPGHLIQHARISFFPFHLLRAGFCTAIVKIPDKNCNRTLSEFSPG